MSRRIAFASAFVLVTFLSVGARGARADIIGVAQAGLLVSVTDISTPGADSILHTGGLFDGVDGFNDRDPGSQTWADVPTALEGADYIQSAQDNADNTDDNGKTLQIDVQVVAGTILHMLIDDRLPNLYGVVMPFPWMNFAGFGADWVDSGEDVLANFPEGRLVFSVWSTTTPLAAGTYSFLQQPRDASFYGITATTAVPEPTTLSLLGLGLAGAVVRRFRKLA